jgi:hypothetical protein
MGVVVLGRCHSLGGGISQVVEKSRTPNILLKDDKDVKALWK